MPKTETSVTVNITPRVLTQRLDADAVVDRTLDVVREWVEEGVDLYPDGYEQLAHKLYAVLGVWPPREPRNCKPCPKCGRVHP